jgi:hypothetical protein
MDFLRYKNSNKPIAQDSIIVRQIYQVIVLGISSSLKLKVHHAYYF